jgi:hypothetical protein
MLSSQIEQQERKEVLRNDQRVREQAAPSTPSRRRMPKSRRDALQRSTKRKSWARTSYQSTRRQPHTNTIPADLSPNWAIASTTLALTALLRAKASQHLETLLRRPFPAMLSNEMLVRLFL